MNIEEFKIWHSFLRECFSLKEGEIKKLGKWAISLGRDSGSQWLVFSREGEEILKIEEERERYISSSKFSKKEELELIDSLASLC